MNHDEHATAAHTGPASAGEHKDPVCGMTVQENTPHRYVHAGKTWFFCSAKCVTKFQADPQRYC